MTEKDQDQRWEVSIECSITWEDRATTGTVVTLSLQSALVTIVDIVPPEGSPCTLTLETDQGEVPLQGRMGPKVVHAGWEPKDQVGIGLLGIDFEGSPDEIREALGPLIPPGMDG